LKQRDNRRVMAEAEATMETEVAWRMDAMRRWSFWVFVSCRHHLLRNHQPSFTPPPPCARSGVLLSI
jgi:hypothetical protein